MQSNAEIISDNKMGHYLKSEKERCNTDWCTAPYKAVDLAFLIIAVCTWWPFQAAPVVKKPKPQSVFSRTRVPFTRRQDKMGSRPTLHWQPNSVAVDKTWRRRIRSSPIWPRRCIRQDEEEKMNTLLVVNWMQAIRTVTYLKHSAPRSKPRPPPIVTISQALNLAEI